MPQPIKKPSINASTAFVGIAACSMQIVAENEIQLTPAGEFRAFDGRPDNAPFWRMDASIAAALSAAAESRGTPYVIDYDHQTLRAIENGKEAPAAGWFSKLEWREGVGLFGIDVDWTATASQRIKAKEFRFISPVITYSPSGDVTGLLMAAITNTPAILGMDEVLIAAASLHYNTQPTASLSQELPQMDELLQDLIWMLNLPVGSTVEDVRAQLDKVKAAITPEQSVAAANGNLLGLITGQKELIASLSAATPDPAKYVPIAAVTEMQSQLAALNTKLNAGNVDKLVTDAIASGKLAPAMEAWAREFGAKDFAALSATLASFPAVMALNSTQTNGKAPDKTTASGALTETQVALCAALGLSKDDYLATLQAEAKA